MYLNINDFVESVLDLSDSLLFPGNIMSDTVGYLKIAAGDGSTIAPPLPHTMTLTVDKTTYELGRSETVLIYEQDGDDADLFLIVRDWANWTPYNTDEEETTTLTAGITAGDTEIEATFTASIAVGHFMRIGRYPDLHRVTEVDGTTYTVEPPINRDYTIGEEVRLVGIQRPSRARAHADNEEALFVATGVHLEELQDAIAQLQINPFPQDLSLRSLTLSKHLQVGPLLAGTTLVGGLVRFEGGDLEVYDGDEWVSLTATGGGGGAELPAGEEGNILVHDGADWISDGKFLFTPAALTIQVGASQFVFAADGGMEVPLHLSTPSLRAQELFVHASDTGSNPAEDGIYILNDGGLGAVLGNFVGGGGGYFATLPFAVLGSSLSLVAFPTSGSGGGLNLSVSDQNGADPEDLTMSLTAGWSVDINGFTVTGEDHTTPNVASFAGSLDVGSLFTALLQLDPVDDYPVSPVDGMMVFHTSHGWRVRTAGVWEPIVGDDLEFTTPGTAWVPLVWDADEEEWLPNAAMKIYPYGVEIDNAIIIGPRDNAMAEQLGLIEFVNNDFMGYVLDPDDNLIRISLTNMSIEQRLPSAAVLGTMLIATTSGDLAVWGASTAEELFFDRDNNRLVLNEIKIGDGLIRWNNDTLEWSDGVTWSGFPVSGSIPAPTTAGTILKAALVEDLLTWVETDAILIDDTVVSVGELVTPILRLGPNGDDEYLILTVDNFTIPEITITSSLTVPEAVIDTLTVTNLVILSQPEDNPAVQFSRLDLTTGGHLFSWQAYADRLALMYDQGTEFLNFAWDEDDQHTGTLAAPALLNATVLSVAGLTGIIEAGNLFEIADASYIIADVSGSPDTTSITLTTGLVAAADTATPFTIRYGRSNATFAGDVTIGRDMIVDRLLKVAYTIQLASHEGGYDGELGGAEEAAGMIRYNGDFQGRLANGQWASFTRTMADGDFDDPYGSFLYWNGTRWLKNVTKVNEAGTILLAEDDATAAVPGAFRFNGTDFQGCISPGVWVTMTALEDLPSLPSSSYENATLRWSGGNWVVNPYLWSDGVKTGVQLLQLAPYEDFYAAGLVNKAGGYLIGATVISTMAFSVMPELGDEIVFANHGTTYEIDSVSGQTITLTSGLTAAVPDRTVITVQGVLARPVPTGGQFRYNQNDYQGFVDGVGWVSFTGHVSQLPTREGDPHLNSGDMLYFNGLNWVSYRGVHAELEAFISEVDLYASQSFFVAGQTFLNGLVVGSPNTVRRGFTTAGYAQGYDEAIAVTGLPASIQAGSLVRLSVSLEDMPLPQTKVYEVLSTVVESGVTVSITLTEALVEAIPSAASIVAADDTDPSPYPGYIYYNNGTQRFRGFVGALGAEGVVDGQWLDLVSPIQEVPVLRNGQTLVYNADTMFWNNTPLFTVGEEYLSPEITITGYTATQLPMKIQSWSFESETTQDTVESELVDRYILNIGCFYEEDTPDDPIMEIHGGGNRADGYIKHNAALTEMQALLLNGALTGAGATLSGNLTLTAGKLDVQVGDVNIDKGDLNLYEGSIFSYDLWADNSIWSSGWVRVGYVEGLATELPIGAMRYSMPNNTTRGDWEGWDGQQWISFTAGFHGQAIWGPTNNYGVAFYDPLYEGGKYRSAQGVTILSLTEDPAEDILHVEGIAEFEQPINLYDQVTLPTGVSGGKIAFKDGEFFGRIDGTTWVSLSHTGTSGLANGTEEGMMLYWTGSAWSPSNNAILQQANLLVNGTLQLAPYADVVSPAPAGGGQIRYNQNDIEGYITGRGWVSLSGNLPFQNPGDHEFAFLWSDGAGWVASEILVGEYDDDLTAYILNLDGMLSATQVWADEFKVDGMGVRRVGDTLEAQTGEDEWTPIVLNEYLFEGSGLVYRDGDGVLVNLPFTSVEESTLTIDFLNTEKLNVAESLSFRATPETPTYMRADVEAGVLIFRSITDEELPTVKSYGPWETPEEYWDTTIEYNDVISIEDDGLLILVDLTKVWTSPDGFTWTEANAAHGMAGIARANAIKHGGAFYIIGGTDDGIDPNAPSGNIYKSTDGITWTLNLAMATPVAEPVLISHGGYLYYIGGRTTEAVSSAVTTAYRTADGSSWGSTTINLPAGSSRRGVIFDGKWIVGPGLDNVGFDSDFYVSTDNGATWTAVAGPSGLGMVTDYLLQQLGDRLYFIGGEKEFLAVSRRVYYTEDSVEDFVRAGDVPLDQPFNLRGISDRTDRLTVIGAYSFSGRTVYLGYEEVEAAPEGDYMRFDMGAGTIDFVVPINVVDANFAGAVTFEQELTLTESLILQSSLVVENAATFAAEGNVLEANTEIGSVLNPKDFKVWGNFEVNGDTTLNEAEIYARRLLTTGYAPVGNSEVYDPKIGSVRYTGARLALASELYPPTSETIEVTGLDGSVILGEGRLAVSNDPTVYEIVSATDLTGGAWELVIAPGLNKTLNEDQEVTILGEGDWEGWDGNFWVSFTALYGGLITPSENINRAMLYWDTDAGQIKCAAALYDHGGIVAGNYLSAKETISEAYWLGSPLWDNEGRIAITHFLPPSDAVGPSTIAALVNNAGDIDVIVASHGEAGVWQQTALADVDFLGHSVGEVHIIGNDAFTLPSNIHAGTKGMVKAPDFDFEAWEVQATPHDLDFAAGCMISPTELFIANGASGGSGRALGYVFDGTAFVDAGVAVSASGIAALTRGCVTEYEGYIYYAGGKIGASDNTNIYKYELASGTSGDWTLVGALPVAPFSGVDGQLALKTTTFKGKFYLTILSGLDSQSLYVTTDFVTWDEQHFGVAEYGTFMLGIVSVKSDDTYIYLIGNNMLLRSTDGTQWTAIATGGTGMVKGREGQLSLRIDGLDRVKVSRYQAGIVVATDIECDTNVVDAQLTLAHTAKANATKTRMDLAAYNSADERTVYARVEGEVESNTNGAEQGSLKLQAMAAGVLKTMMKYKARSSGGDLLNIADIPTADPGAAGDVYRWAGLLAMNASGGVQVDKWRRTINPEEMWAPSGVTAGTLTTFRPTGSAQIEIKTISFAVGGTQYIGCPSVKMPSNYAGQALKLTWEWTCSVAGASGTVAWSYRYLAQDGDNTTINVTDVFVNAPADTLLAVEKIHRVSQTFTPTISADGTLWHSIRYLGGTSTITQVPRLISLTLEYA